jgi:hypothetical protein
MPKRVYTRAYASVRFMAPELDPLEITNALRLPPDSQHRRGEPRINRSAKGVVNEYAPYRFGLWSMSSEQWVDSRRLETHLKWLLDELEPCADAFSSLDITDLRIDLFCFSMGASPSPPSIPRSIIERADRLGISVDIDHYDSTNDESVA